jgi:hypothetical protein
MRLFKRLLLPRLGPPHRARAAALIRARPAAEMWRLGLGLLAAEPLFRFAHLALCAAAIRLRAAADMRPCVFWQNAHPAMSEH